MGMKTRMVGSLALATLLLISAPARSVLADEPDVLTELEKFENEKKREIESAISEVTEMLAKQQQAVTSLQDQVKKTQVVLERLHAMKQALASIDAPEPISPAVSIPASAHDVPVVQTEVAPENLPPMPSRTMPHPVKVTGSVKTVGTTVPSLQAVEPHTCVEEGPCCGPDAALAGSALPEHGHVEIQATPSGTLQVVAVQPMANGHEERVEISCSHLVLQPNAIVAINGEPLFRNVGVGRSVHPPVTASPQVQALEATLQQIRKIIEAAHPSGECDVPPPVVPETDETVRRSGAEVETPEN